MDLKIISKMQGLKHKNKHDGKKHKKARVARFITSYFFYYNINQAIETARRLEQPQKTSRNKNQPRDVDVIEMGHVEDSSSPDSSSVSESFQSDETSPKDILNNNSRSSSFKNLNSHTGNYSLNSSSNSKYTNYQKYSNFDKSQIIEIETVSKPFPQCVKECVPSSFDIVRRGPLPSIVFQNNEVKLLW
ncbi:hypothetical protein TRFO_10816 [Tritrichomonas foetus]|uniref:Uncharacterized protein n=1 Tax=Tritrichomonas foetus TaxID=1144522 RepID=A0A1J4J6M5_9EUKA|nr:hypothetical protein TRFO_10816 [Tritrichomonas foetus]|eukprot:OHS94882.1 hypothetical protein TRFO_10816 [Tritrichomonas foetus]